MAAVIVQPGAALAKRQGVWADSARLGGGLAAAAHPGFSPASMRCLGRRQ